MHLGVQQKVLDLVRRQSLWNPPHIHGFFSLLALLTRALYARLQYSIQIECLLCICYISAVCQLDFIFIYPVCAVNQKGFFNRITTGIVFLQSLEIIFRNHDDPLLKYYSILNYPSLHIYSELQLSWCFRSESQRIFSPVICIIKRIKTLYKNQA